MNPVAHLFILHKGVAKALLCNFNLVQHLILCDTECQFQKSMRLYRSGRNWLQDSVRLKWGQWLKVAGLFIKVTLPPKANID